MIKLQFTQKILAPASIVYDQMLGLTQISTYELWTATFNPTSSYRGTWEKGSKMHFYGQDEAGNDGGMVSEIVEHIASKFISIRHFGLLKGEEEITSGPEVEKWTGGHENYTFSEAQGETEVLVELEAAEDFVEYFNETYPSALLKLKELCER